MYVFHRIYFDFTSFFKFLQVLTGSCHHHLHRPTKNLHYVSLYFSVLNFLEIILIYVLGIRKWELLTITPILYKVIWSKINNFKYITLKFYKRCIKPLQIDMHPDLIACKFFSKQLHLKIGASLLSYFLPFMMYLCICSTYPLIYHLFHMYLSL